MPRRSELKLVMKTLKPAFSCPTRLCTGTRQRSNRKCAVSDDHQPIFFNSVRERPGVSPSITSAEMPPAPLFSGLVRTATVKKSARMPEVMNTFSPLTT